MPTEILIGLWIGDYNDSQNIPFIKNNNIKYIINCTNNLNFQKIDNINKIRIPLSDHPNHNYINNNKKMLKYLDNTINIIYDNINKNNNILIHCNKGIQRSPTIILAYLIKFGKISKKEAISFLKSKNENFFMPHHNFDYSINKFINLLK